VDSSLIFHGFFTEANTGLWVLASVIGVLMTGYFTSPLFIWAVVITGLLYLFGAPLVVVAAVAVVFLVFLIKPIRAALISNFVLGLMKKLNVIPTISETERIALEAGVVWVEADLFSGKPDFKKIMNETYPSLTAEEQAFLNGPVETLCSMINDWEVWKKRELSKESWDYIKKEKFLGMIIPKEYGGLGFSALAHAAVIQKLSSRNMTAAITVMVPNSLGPAELLVHYGTDAQKNYYLPRLATGEEVPCFGLTEPGAGSDAGSITSSGEVFKGEDGKLYMKINWNKRYITLAAIASVIGLAFRLRDPKNLLGKGEDLGITAALIPASTPGVVIGRRHDPLNVPFYNCPTQGHDVIVSIDQIVGGADGAGKGWSMLMECLAAGRGISLPSQSVGGSKLVARTVSSYGVVRKQFGVSIGKFEGIEEPLARIVSSAYAVEALRTFTCGAIDKGIKPPVITAMAKYYSTEISREVINDGMDILGGAAISMGPRNLLGGLYIATPIGITVEGANILTRTLIVFGQGALRAHPYAFKEVDAVGKGDLKAFDDAFWGHIGHVVRNACRSIVLSVTRGYFASSPVSGELAVYYRRLSWASASFAIMSDIAMGSLGGALKMKEKVTGRFADILAWMYIGTCVLRRYEAEGRKKEDLPIVHYVMKRCLVEIQLGFDGIFDNLKVPGLRWFFKGWLGAWSRINSIGSQGSDGLQHRVCETILEPGQQRDRLTAGIYVPTSKTEALGRLENAMMLVKKSESIEKKLRAAVKSGQLPKLKGAKLAEEGKVRGIITSEEFATMHEADVARTDAIQVDDFSEIEFKNNPSVMGK
jgi:acyl-CoA dehydrogenase